MQPHRRILPALPQAEGLILSGARVAHQSPNALWRQEMPCCELRSIGSCIQPAGISITGMPWFAIAQFASRLQPPVLILARDSPGSFEEEPRWTVSLLQDGHRAMRQAGLLPGAAGPGRGWDRMAHPSRSFPPARHHGSLQAPLLKCLLPYAPFPSLGASWQCEKLRLRHAVSPGAWEKVLQTARQCPEAQFQLLAISFLVMLSPQAPALPLCQQLQFGQGPCVLMA